MTRRGRDRLDPANLPGRRLVPRRRRHSVEPAVPAGAVLGILTEHALQSAPAGGYLAADRGRSRGVRVRLGGAGAYPSVHRARAPRVAPRRGTQGSGGAPHRPRPSRADRAHRPALRDIRTRRRRLRPLRNPHRRDASVGCPAPGAPSGRPPRPGRRRAQAGIPVPRRAPDLLLRRPSRHRPAGARRARHPVGRHAHRPRAVGAGAAAPHPFRGARGGAQPGHAVRRAPQRDLPVESPGGLGAPASGRTARAAAADVGSGSLRAAGLRGERSRPESGQGAGGDRGGGASAPPGRGGVDRGAAHAVRPGQARRPAPRRGLESRAGEPRAAGARDRRPDAGERRRHGDGAHHAGVRWRLGRPRQR